MLLTKEEEFFRSQQNNVICFKKKLTEQENKTNKRELNSNKLLKVITKTSHTWESSNKTRFYRNVKSVNTRDKTTWEAKQDFAFRIR